MDAKPSRNEEEFFKKQDAELIKHQRAKLDADRLRAERSSHYMKCPKCGADLAERAHHHIKIDVCAECNGVWFDAGELDMLNRVEQGLLGGFVRTLFRMEK